ncbi:MAG: metallophosphoesterase [Alphaproteobacteria bacterium]|nr:metallophosphoesterase [Alphaproteobacteria bacterium]
MTTLVVGDVHGCADELARLVDVVQPTRLVLVGDLYTKGPDPGGVWSILREAGAEAVLGNHDARLLDVIDGRRPGDVDGAACVEALDRTGPGWRAHLAALPLFLEGVGPYTVVHGGLAPDGDLQRTTRAMAISLRRLPGEGAPLWHEAYTGTRPVIFGHDARGGLVWWVRDGHPHVVGLDTGCCYGGVLSGFVVEAERLVQVPARRVYRTVDGRRVEAT